jgi:hypothetical protein
MPRGIGLKKIAGRKPEPLFQAHDVIRCEKLRQITAARIETGDVGMAGELERFSRGQFLKRCHGIFPS